MEEIKKIFTPEFRNRLDNIIWFDHLSTEVIHQVVDKFIVELQVQLDQKGVSLEVSEARNWLAEKGYDRAMGARPMARVIQDNLKKPLANELLFGSLVDGGRDGGTGSGEERTDVRFPECGEAQAGSGSLISYGSKTGHQPGFMPAFLPPVGEGRVRASCRREILRGAFQFRSMLVLDKSTAINWRLCTTVEDNTPTLKP